MIAGSPLQVSGPAAGLSVVCFRFVDPSLADELATAALNRAGVAEFTDRRTDELSGGEWQRVRIARALAQEGGALVLDEPTTFLDMPHEMALFELLDSLARDGLAVLIVSHQLNLLARFARSIVLLNRGKVAAAGIGVTNAGPTAIRSRKAEEILRGQSPDDKTIAAAAAAAASEAKPWSDLRGPAEYKVDVIRVLTQRAIRKAVTRATGGK